jgi:hypothetical protein
MTKFKETASGNWVPVESFWERHKLLPKVMWVGEANSWLMEDYGHIRTNVLAMHKDGVITLETAHLKKACLLIRTLLHEFAHFLIWRLKLPKFLNDILDFKICWKTR